MNKTSHVRIIMTVVVAARLLILVQGFSSKVEWAAKTNHASIEVAALNCIKSFSAQAPRGRSPHVNGRCTGPDTSLVASDDRQSEVRIGSLS